MGFHVILRVEMPLPREPGSPEWYPVGLYAKGADSFIDRCGNERDLAFDRVFRAAFERLRKAQKAHRISRKTWEPSHILTYMAAALLQLRPVPLVDVVDLRSIKLVPNLCMYVTCDGVQIYPQPATPNVKKRKRKP